MNLYKISYLHDGRMQLSTSGRRVKMKPCISGGTTCSHIMSMNLFPLNLIKNNNYESIRTDKSDASLP